METKFMTVVENNTLTTIDSYEVDFIESDKRKIIYHIREKKFYQITKLSIWQSFLLTISGYLLSVIILSLMGVVLSVLKITPNEMMFNPVIACNLQTVELILFISIGLIVYKKGIGFMFVSDKLDFNSKLKNNYILMILVWSLF